MPRSSRGRSAPRAPPSRPTVTSAAPKQQPTNFNRTNTSLAPTPTTSKSPAANPQSRASEGQGQSQGGGLLANVASTAAGVAIGHSIGNAIGGLFGGGSSAPDVESSPAATSLGQSEFSDSVGRCGPLMKEFTQCMELNNNMGSCQWIFDQLKLCQQPSNKDM